jgi:hypothetical protein
MTNVEELLSGEEAAKFDYAEDRFLVEEVPKAPGRRSP